MTRGVLLFAHNNEQINYGLMAYWQAGRIRKYLNVGSSLVTDQSTANALDSFSNDWRNRFDHIIIQESSSTQTKRYGNADNQLTFHNADRTDAWILTPYDETIVIDTDVLIQTDRLNKLWNNHEDLLVCDRCTDLYGNTEHEFTWLSDRGIKFYWATVFYFRKTEYTKLFFEHCKHTKELYGWLAHVHEIPAKPLRNDYVWSIALHDLGHPAPTIPFNLLYSTYEDKLLDSSEDAVQFLTKHGLCKIKHDVHMLNKYDLMEQVLKEVK